jgi:hypothetical protein
MLINLYSLILFFFAVTNALSQTRSENIDFRKDKLLVEKSNDSLVIDSKTDLQIQKKLFDSSQKASPDVFYIINDKPVSREEYLEHINKKR